jgi:hypothetical protein
VAYREVTMVEIKEVLRLWLAGAKKKRVARQLGLDPKTVRQYVRVAEACGLSRAAGVAALTDDLVADVVVAVRAGPQRVRGDAWDRCTQTRAAIEQWLTDGVRLTKVRKLLARRGQIIPYSTLHRFAVAELSFGRQAPTVPVADGKPGEEVQLDTGWMTHLEPDATGRRRRFRAWIFTPHVSRYRFVWPCFRETTETAIEACETAWEFYGGVYRVLVPDNTKAIVQRADPLEPLLNTTFLEYAQARGFQIDPTRVRKPKDKGRVEKSVRDVRDDCFAGETLVDLDAARRCARLWSEHEYGMRRHTRTNRMPREHFDAVEKTALLPAPTGPYDIPLYCTPIVGKDHYAQVARALYSLPTRYIGYRLHARADKTLVRFCTRQGQLVKTCPRQLPGGKFTDPTDFPSEKAVYALRDVACLQRRAQENGEHVGRYAEVLLAGPLPWTRMRQVYALLGLVRRYGGPRVDEACRIALGVDMLSVRRLQRMLELAMPAPTEKPPASATVIPLARYLRPAKDYALPCVREANSEEE